MDDKSRQATRLWTLAQPVVSAFVTSVVRDFKDRDDVLQEIAVAAIESFDAYDPDRPFVPWVMGVARNQIGLYLRQRRRDRLVGRARARPGRARRRPRRRGRDRAGSPPAPRAHAPMPSMRAMVRSITSSAPPPIDQSRLSRK